MSKSTNSNGGCLLLIILGINFLIGGWSVDVILSWFGKDIPFIADMLIGLFLAEVSVPVAIVGIILRAFGVF